jgi:hypothetical protein
MCQSWTTPDNLASAIKTAIINAIETDPKSGWVRTNELPSWNMVDSLKERISELEGRKSPKKREPQQVSAEESMDFAATVVWSEFKPPYRYGCEEDFSQEFNFKMSHDALFAGISLKPGKSCAESGLKERLQKSLAKLCTDKISNRLEQTHINYWRKTFAAGFPKYFQCVRRTRIYCFLVAKCQVVFLDAEKEAGLETYC